MGPRRDAVTAIPMAHAGRLAARRPGPAHAGNELKPIRGNVHNSVRYPARSGPFTGNATSFCFCRTDNRGGRPGAGFARNAVGPAR